MRRVVVTGLGLVTPLGADVETAWANLLAGKSGAGPITRFDASEYKCRIACEVKPADHPYGFDPNKRVDHKVQRQVDPFIVFGIDAAGQALEDAGLTDMDQATKERTGCSIGLGIGGLPGIESELLVLHEKGPGRVSPHFVHGRLINLISGQVSIKYGLMGPNHAVVTACSTGAHSIGDAARMIREDDADIMLAGGAEATICPIGIAGFAQARALNMTYNDRPEAASRPYDKDRDGFVMGEGAGVLVLEEYEHAKARGAKIYAEVVGYGLSGDAYHVTAPHPEGRGAELAMLMALKKAGLGAGDIDYVNAHGTSTMADTIELGAVKRVLGDDLSGASMSSTKSAIGHLLGGAGAVEAIFCILAIRDQIVPPTLNLDNPDEGTEGVDLVPHVARKREVRAVLNNSFGFGGTNASLIMKQVEDWGEGRDPVRKLIVIAVVVAVLLVAGRFSYGWYGSGPLEKETAFVVPDGSSLTSVAAKLEAEGAIASADAFLTPAKLLGSSEPIKAGEFLLPAGASGAAILDILQGNVVIRRFVTVPEGMPSIMVHERLMAQKMLTGTIPVPPDGSLLPDSYDFERGESRAAVVARMQAAMAKTLKELWAKRSPDIAVKTPEEALSLAAIVEKETGKASERRMVAGLYSNRLRTGMMLQADPTIIYPITRGKPLGRRIRQSEIAAINDYNTYSMVGLPKGPITNPGRASIEAVLNPAKTDALYMVADGTGGHAFAATLAEHNANVAKWFAIRRARGEL